MISKISLRFNYSSIYLLNKNPIFRGHLLNCALIVLSPALTTSVATIIALYMAGSYKSRDSNKIIKMEICIHFVKVKQIRHSLKMGFGNLVRYMTHLGSFIYHICPYKVLKWNFKKLFFEIKHVFNFFCT